MENNNGTNEVVNETTQSEEVSNEQIQTESNDSGLPKSQEELDVLLKSASNKAKTDILKDLEVNSIKEFKETQASLREKYSEYDSKLEKLNEYVGQNETLESELQSLKRERVLDKLNVQDEYRDDLTKLAMSKVDDSNDFDTVINKLVEGNYKFTVQQSTKPKIGVEKSEQSSDDTQKLSRDTLRRMPWLK
jgi:hypothetical protein